MANPYRNPNNGQFTTFWGALGFALLAGLKVYGIILVAMLWIIWIVIRSVL